MADQMTFSLGQQITDGTITGRIIARVKASGVPCVAVQAPGCRPILLPEAVCREVEERRLKLVWSEGEFV